jgi:hypothetical protein
MYQDVVFPIGRGSFPGAFAALRPHAAAGGAGEVYRKLRRPFAVRVVGALLQ